MKYVQTMIVLFVVFLRGYATNESQFCDTQECHHIVDRIQRNMDTSVEPCTDFYNFVCGGFKENYTIPDDDTKVSSFTIINDKIMSQIKALLEDESLGNEQKSFVLPQTHYKACMNEDAIESLGLKPLEDILEALGGWPLLKGSSWSNTSFHWHEKVIILRQRGFSTHHFLSLSVGPDMKNSSQMVLGLDQPKLALHHKDLSEGRGNSKVDSYFRHMLKTTVDLFGGGLLRSVIDMLNVLHFETKLARIKVSEEKQRNVTDLYHALTIEELSKLDPHTPWLSYINGILGGDKVNPSQKIVLSSPTYFQRFSALMLRTPSRVQANYIIWKVVMNSLTHLNTKAQRRAFEYSKDDSGVRTMKSRWKTCVNEVGDTFDIPVGAMYIKTHFKNETMGPIQDLVAQIKDVLSQHFLKNEWFDEGTRQRALEKLKLIRNNIAYPKEILDDNLVQKFYSGLNPGEMTYFENRLQYKLFIMNYMYSRLGKQNEDSLKWILFGSPAIVNAYYDPLGNSINIPAGILQGNFFSSQLPMFWNFGGIGSVIGHEITHGFDDVGRQFDGSGNMVDWWNPETKKLFIQRTKCLVKEYGDFKNPQLNMTVNGKLTLGENIADNEGMRVAYEAYDKFLNESALEEEKRFRGLDFSPKQLFWISLANVWCGRVRPESRSTLFHNVHPPALYRVIGPLRNMPEFSKDFNCPLGSPMNPNHKCRIW